MNYENPIEAMFYTNLIAYSYIPNKETIVDLINQGYTVIINDNKIPNQISTIQGVIIVKLTAANNK